MPAQDFTSLGDLMTTVRLHTEFDVYHFSVDNRPLTDLISCFSTTSAMVNSTRKRLGNVQIADNLATVYGLGVPSRPADTNKFIIQGCVLMQGGANQVLLEPGVIYQTPAGAAFPYQFPVTSETVFSLTGPTTSGNEKWVVIQMNLNYRTAATPTLPTGSIPFEENTDSTMYQADYIGSLTFSTKDGLEATAGTAVKPLPDAGMVAFAYVKLAAGNGNVQEIIYCDGRRNTLSGRMHLIKALDNPGTEMLSGTNLRHTWSLDKASATKVDFYNSATEFRPGFANVVLVLEADAAGNFQFNFKTQFTVGTSRPTSSVLPLVLPLVAGLNTVRLTVPVNLPVGATALAGQIERLPTNDTITGMVRIHDVLLDL